MDTTKNPLLDHLEVIGRQQVFDEAELAASHRVVDFEVILGVSRRC